MSITSALDHAVQQVQAARAIARSGDPEAIRKLQGLRKEARAIQQRLNELLGAPPPQKLSLGGQLHPMLLLAQAHIDAARHRYQTEKSDVSLFAFKQAKTMYRVIAKELKEGKPLSVYPSTFGQLNGYAADKYLDDHGLER